ncbi:putative rnp domain-containing protein [Phaeomoniella chlamydospora]|uniref:Putative rnp domain-containing protein n=1 Tax=Phaeomoniella chlamydospora TaxID=158046 RepID=A0A0G2FXR4_PHACM|nr:putative rnp domain-containing protein [Phaeomoniella chlamydospora]
MSTAVDNLADNMAAASIQDPAQDSVAASAAEGRRLYIGNLAYATTEGELKKFFEAYEVESTSIPVNPRTNRPVGYAFVDLKSATDAEKAISELSGKEILERKVSVQLARKPEPAGDKTEGEGDAKAKRGSGRGRGRGRGRGGRLGRGGRTGATGEATEAAETLPLTEKTNEANAEAPKEAKAPRPPKQRGPPEDGIPSKTKVMVANLPYDLTEEKLQELFAAYQPTSAKIALRPIPRFMVKKLQARGEPRKGRGFGFVTLESEEQQQKAVEEMNGKQIEGREIAVKVAIDSPGKEDGEETQENGVTEEAAAPAA